MTGQSESVHPEVIIAAEREITAPPPAQDLPSCRVPASVSVEQPAETVLGRRVSAKYSTEQSEAGAIPALSNCSPCETGSVTALLGASTRTQFALPIKLSTFVL